MVSLPWIPGLSPKLRKVFRNAGYKAVFKSGANLRTILTSKNKTKLPQNSHPGVYKIYCSCGKMYIGETGCKVSTRLQQHQKDLLEKEKKKTTSGVAEHACECDGTVDWSKVETIKVENKRFERKVREALDIQNNHSNPREGGMNQDYGQYVNHTFWRPLMKHLQRKNIAMTS